MYQNFRDHRKIQQKQQHKLFYKSKDEEKFNISEACVKFNVCRKTI